MKLRISALLLCLYSLLISASCLAQTGYTTVSSTHLTDSTGSTISNATIQFAPVAANGQGISFQVNGNGQSISAPVQTQVTNGTFTINLADTNLTKPQNVCFSVTVTDNTSGNVLLGSLGYNCVQPQFTTYWCTSGNCIFDQYQPNLASLAVNQTGPAGPAGPACSTGTGTCVMTVPIQLPADPTQTQNAATKHYVDFSLVFPITAYGAVSGAPDVTGPVQSAINEATVVGGTVYFPPGVWNINGPINPACDGIICIPAIAATAQSAQVKIMGTTRVRQDSQGTTSNIGSVIVSTTAGVDPFSAVFNVPQVSGGFANDDNIDVYFSGLTIRNPPNPGLGCIRMYYAAGAAIDNVRCEIGESYTGTSHTQPVNVATGITLPQTGNDTLSRLTWSQVSGYYQGVSASEHAYFESDWVAFGIQGLFISPGFNTIYGHIGFEEVATPIVVGIGPAVVNLDIGIEQEPTAVGVSDACAPWCYSGTDISDPSNFLTGYIHYDKTQAVVGHISDAIVDSSVTAPYVTFYNNWMNQQSRIQVPILTAFGGNATFIPGTGVTSVTCVTTTQKCNSSRGVIQITVGGAPISPGPTVMTLGFGDPFSQFTPLCQVVEEGSTTYHGFNVSSTIAASFTVNSAVTLPASSIVTLAYSCQL